MDATCRHLLRMALSEVNKKIDGEPIIDRHLMRQGAYLLHNVIDEAINKALMSGGLEEETGQ